MKMKIYKLNSKDCNLKEESQTKQVIIAFAEVDSSATNALLHPTFVGINFLVIV